MPTIAFVGYGLEYLAMAANAARGLRENSPGTRSLCITNVPVEGTHLSTYFDEVIYRDEPDSMNRLAKVRAIHDIEDESGGFIDSDVEIIGDLAPLFQMLERFDLLIHTARLPTKFTFFIDEGLPSVLFPQFYGGFLFFRRNPQVRRLFATWESRLVQSGIRRDQPSLQRAVWDHPEVRLLPLNTVWGAVGDEYDHHRELNREPVRILHYGDVSADTAILNRVSAVLEDLRPHLPPAYLELETSRTTLWRFAVLSRPTLRWALTSARLDAAWRFSAHLVPRRLLSIRRKHDRAAGEDHLGGRDLWRDEKLG